MTELRHYTNAPITEAIIDLRVTPRDGLTLADVDSIHEGLEDDYPDREDTIEAVGIMEVRAGVGASASARQSRTGSKYRSADGKYIWQIRLDGSTFTRLAPYESWEPFRDEAHRLWKLYRDKVSPKAITRLAVRYINRVDIPVSCPDESVDLQEYFRTSPEISSDLPQRLNQFFLRLAIPYAPVGGTAVINQTIIPPPKEGVVSVVLDIDLVRSEGVPYTDSEIWTIFESLHDGKNDIFEACITPKTRKLFD
ncbi:MAG: TIGR04255 family protein [Planctomycetota bacterium]|nr:TIGR04255 family protein [Planctomycetota bacterium]MDA1165874.1 TIGR04255 family protein [Planctomycetota bacterium]